MIVLVTGGRYYEAYDYVQECLDAVHWITPVQCVIHGACEVYSEAERRYVKSGADWFADQWAFNNEVRVDRQPVSREDWKTLGKSAGPRRNERMAKIVAGLQAQHGWQALCVAFLGDAGTKNMCETAERYGIPVWRTWAHPLTMPQPRLTGVL